MTTRFWPITVAVFIIVLFVAPGALTLVGQPYRNPYQFASASSSSSGPMFVWFFGYAGGTFYPQTELGITPTQMISAASSMSSAVGSNTELRFVAAINQLPGSASTVINWSNATLVSELQQYVSSLDQYGQVYGRIDLEQFNWTGTTTAYEEVSFYYNDLGISGVWFDHAAVLYGSNETAFNSMMQNLTQAFPNLIFILNQSTKSKTGGQIIQPSSGMTWNQETYISPSVLINTYNEAPQVSMMKEYNQIYPGRVLLHFDSYAQTKDEPMGIFAEQSTKVEETTIQNLASQGASQASESAGFSLLYPVLGAWTYNGKLTAADVDYKGTLYNSLSIGTYARSTSSSFISTMSEYP